MIDDRADWRAGAFLSSYGKTLGQLQRHAEAQVALLEAHEILEAARGPQHQRTIKTINALVDLYQAWDTPEPGKGYAAKAAKWRGKLPKTQAPPAEKPRSSHDNDGE